MNTWPTYGGRYYRSTNSVHHWVVKIVKGSSVWLFSDTQDMELTDGHVYPLLKDNPVLECDLDFVTKRWSVHDVRVVIKNARYKRNTSNILVSFADEVAAIRTASISIYILAGPDPTSLSDGLEKFSGEISDPAIVTAAEIQLRAIDGARRRSAVLPQTDIADSVIPRRKSPIVYGAFNRDYNNYYNPIEDLGLVRCELLQGAHKTFNLVAGHACYALSSAFWVQRNLPHPSLLVSPTLTANDSGRCTINASKSGDAYGDVYADAYLYADGTYRGASTDGYGYDDLCSVVNPQNVNDLDHASYASVIDTINGSAVNAHAYFSWPDYAIEELNVANSIGIVLGETISGAQYVYLQWLIGMPDIEGTAYVNLINAGTTVSETLDNNIAQGKSINIGSPSNWTNQLVWHLRSGRLEHAGQNKPLVAVVRTDTTKTPNTPGREVFRVYFMRLVLRYIVKMGTLQRRYLGWPKVGGFLFAPILWEVKEFMQIDGVVYAAVEGRKFGSWIDEGGRSNSYNANGLIQDPAFIIESILRDELGFGASEIDVASFDAAANSSVRARLHISSDNEGDAFSFIRQLAEQSTFAFTVSGVSKPRLIPLNVTNPTIARTLDLTDIGGDVNSLRLSEQSKIVNDIKVKHRWTEEFGDYRSFINYIDATSQAALGVFAHEFEWPNITGRAGDDNEEFDVCAVAKLILELWKTQHPTISVVCPGIRNSDLEIGDWIQFDPTTIDPHLLCFGASWSGKKFLISSVRVTRTATTIEAVQLL